VLEGEQMILLAILLVLLTGCITVDKYPDVCDLTKPDPDGKAYTQGRFPCKLTRHAVKEQP
jgi:hypothetical protein